MPKVKLNLKLSGGEKKHRIYFGLIILFDEARAIAAHYVRQLICQIWFTDSINATFRRRSPYGKFRDLRLLRAQSREQSRALAYTSHQSLRIALLPDFSARYWFPSVFFPLPAALPSLPRFKRRFVKAKEKNRTKKQGSRISSQVEGPFEDTAIAPAPLAPYFNSEFSKHRATFDRVYAEEWPAVKQQATNHTWATTEYFVHRLWAPLMTRISKRVIAERKLCREEWCNNCYFQNCISSHEDVSKIRLL